MKYCIIVPDGAADYAVPRLKKRTPLQAARTPNMDRAASDGMLGLACHVPKRMTAGSSVAMMSVTGYDPAIEFTGRAPLEAADMGLELARGQWAVRCNFITRADDSIADFTAGHISTAEAALLIAAGEHPKVIESLLGHASISTTLDTYGHLFPNPEDDQAKLSMAELSIVG